MNFIEIGCSALKYTVSIDTCMNGKKMSTNRKNYHGRPIIFALIAFSIASMIMASIKESEDKYKQIIRIRQ